MLQTSISTWLQKPKAVREPAPETVQLEPQQKKRKQDLDASTAAAVDAQARHEEDAKDKVSRSPRSPCAKAKETKTCATALPPQPFATKSRLRPLPPNVDITHLDASTLHSFRRLNSLLLEIPYPPKFYDETLSDPVVHSLSLAAFWRDNVSASPATTTTRTAAPPRKPILIAGIRCRVLTPSSLPLPSANGDGSAGGSTTLSSSRGPILYIATLATLSPYRALGLATHLLARVTGTAAREHGVQAVVAHVWERNEEGLDWYKARGFEVLGKEEEYYRKLRPMGAWVVRRRVGVADLLEDGQRREGEQEREKMGGDQDDAVE
ncbi:hypothetical protein HDK64DRAFT_31303 [Phyllosticta capitalensis]